MRRWVALIACGALLTVVSGMLATQGDQTRRVPAFLLLFGLAAMAYLVALWAARGLSRRGVALALVAAAAWRVALVLAPPLLSDDMYRYVWEGRIQLKDGNPYAWSDRPESQRWIDLRDEVWRGVSYKHFTAIYPPLWQLAARAVVAVDDSVAAMKAFVVLCEVALWLVLLGLLARRAQPLERVLILAWNPLALVEVAGSGHNDSAGMLLAAAALLLLESRRPVLSAVAAALGAQVKLLPGLLVAAWARRYRLWHVVVAGLAAGLLVLPYAGEPAGLVRSLMLYGRRWRFNDSLFTLIGPAIGHGSAVTAGAVLTLLLGVLLAWRRVEPARAALIVTAAWLLLAANVLPWYALWLLPWLVLVEAPALLAFTLTVPLAYLVYPAFLAGGPWRVGWDVRALEYGIPVAVAVGMGVARWWRRRSGASPRDRAAQHVLIVLLKRPVAGEAKTRLIPALGAEDAAHLYRLLAEAVMRSTAPSHGEYARRLFAAPAGSVGEIERWFPGEICRPQAAGDLGTRLATAFDEAFASGAARAVIIGSDAPALGADDVRKALAALDHADVVLGAAEDGGYTLIALARPAPELFRDIAWSTPQVLAATRTRAEEAGLAVHVLAPPFRDIDTLDDVRAEWRTLRPIVARDPELLARIEPLVGRPGPPGT